MPHTVPPAAMQARGQMMAAVGDVALTSGSSWLLLVQGSAFTGVEMIPQSQGVVSWFSAHRCQQGMS